jgi:hypothetical protein
MNVVITNLIGGLGNQMFQYAAGRALALRSGADLMLDLSGFENYPLRRYELGAFSIQAAPAEIPAGAESPAPSSRWRSRIGRWIGLETKAMVAGVPVYRESHFHFDPHFASLRAPVHIVGYWQTPKYFNEIADVLRRDFTPKAPMDAGNAEIAGQIASCNSVSLHVRRGDYVSNPETGNYHGICSIDYYKHAVALICERVPDPRLFVFSDDHRWVRDNLQFDLPTQFVAANTADQGTRDIHLMAQCRHHILANSSFSWWGAWLNPSPDKIIVAPQKWFNVSTIDTRDLVPVGWIRI